MFNFRGEGSSDSLSNMLSYLDVRMEVLGSMVIRSVGLLYPQYTNHV